MNSAVILKVKSYRFFSSNVLWPIISIMRDISMTSDQLLSRNLKEIDSELNELINAERQRQFRGLELIASENYTSVSVLQCLGSCLTNKYSEGMPGARYYGGNQFIDKIELLCQKRALDAFNLDPEKWGCNVQPYSGSPANFAVYTALVNPHGKIMGLDLSDGGHLTHGFKTEKKKISATSIFFESMLYKVNPSTGLIDYDKLAETARLFKPNLIIAGTTCYSRYLDYKRFREICDENDSIMLADMSHISGLVAAGVIPSPFEYADVISSTTHKTLRGPRAGIIFYKKGVKYITENGEKIMFDFEEKINNAVFPSLQGGPHNNAIAAIATTMLQVKTDEFRKYQEQVLLNAKKLSIELEKLGYYVVTGGTDVHLILIDLVKSFKVTGSKAEFVLELVDIACNKNTVPGDKSPLNPSGLRLGTPALTTRGFKEEDMVTVASLIHKGILLAKEVQSVSGPKLVNFKSVLMENETFKEKIESLKNEVQSFAEKFFMPTMDY
ncbi:hypothetical protein PGB90_007551 [Kerria lacca]